MDNSASPRLSLVAIALCIALLLAFATTAWNAAAGKSATADEPNHVVTGWFMLWQKDFRLSPDVPPLWEDWIALAIGKDALHFNSDSAEYRNIMVHRQMAAFNNYVLYDTPGNDPLATVNRARAACLVVGLALGALIAGWTWQIGGPIAAVVATFLYCLDPNFLGHAALAKNDVASAMTFLAAAYAVWRAGRRLTIANFLAVVLLTAAAVAVKFSGLLLAPVLVLAFGIRAILIPPWPVFGRSIHAKSAKLGIAAVLCLSAGIVTYAGLWACYDFRFNSGPDGLRLDTMVIVDRLRNLQLRQQLHREPTAAEMAAWRAPLLTRFDLFIEAHRLLPEAWTTGFVNTENEDQGQRSGYLMGETYPGGKWYYFPMAALFKEPLTTIVVVLGALGAIRLRYRSNWTAIAMLIPAGVYAMAMLTAQVNIGLRHAFPIFPFVFMGAGLAWASWWKNPILKTVSAVLAVLLIAETAGAFPNYIAFFNVAFVRDRMHLLTDSNLDWGQDLPLLAAWQRKNPDATLYLDYFGRCEPSAYHIRYVKLPEGFKTLANRPAGQRAFVAISATILEQFNDNPQGLREFGLSPNQKPEKVMGGTIYLFSIQ